MAEIDARLREDVHLLGELLGETFRAERGADGDLALTADDAHQREVGEVGAGDEQDGEDDAGQQQDGAGGFVGNDAVGSRPILNDDRRAPSRWRLHGHPGSHSGTASGQGLPYPGHRRGLFQRRLDCQSIQ